MKNVTLVEVTRDGKQSWRLLGPNGKPITAFDIFANTLLRNSINTRKSYCKNLAEFFDYLIEAGNQLAEANPDLVIDRLLLSKILESYDSYLVEGEHSGNEIAQLVHRSIPSTIVSGTTSSQYHAALRRFLKLSEKIRSQMAELQEAGFEVALTDPMPLIAGVGERRALTQNERTALRTNSMLAGVISRGAKFIEEKILPTAVSSITYDDERAFPFDRVTDLLNQFTCYRDKALYAFCAASGCRVSEGLQLLWEDIDIAQGKVKLLDPKKRRHHPSYLNLTPLQRDRLVWKGRETELTLLIEPFRHLFFEYLEKYVKEEYVAHGRHQFVFQYNVDGIDGVPYFLSDAGSRSKVFRGAVTRAGIEIVDGVGPHGLRHMYGTYLLNYFPRPDGTYGLSMSLVQKILGHATIKATQKYARHDRDLLEAELAFANQVVFKGSGVRSIAEIRKAALQAQLDEVEKDLLREKERRSLANV